MWGHARRAAWLPLVLGMVLGLLSLRALPAQDAAPSLVDADRLYAEKSYAGALRGYEAALKAKTVPAGRTDEVAYRVVESLGKTQQWDRALAEGVEFVKGRRGTVWEARGLYWLGRLYVGVPHQAWRVGDRVYRGNEVPKEAGSAAPERVFLQEQDSANALDALEAARVYLGRFRAAHRTEADEIQLDFDLARMLAASPAFYRWAQAKEWAAPGAPEWEVNPAAEYDPAWAPPKRLMYLYEQARLLAGKTAQGAVAEFGKAVWLRGYQQMMQSWALRFEDGKPVRIPYPYESVEPVALLRSLVRAFPEDALRDQAQVTIGQWLEEDGKPAEALVEYRRFLEERPASHWLDNARQRVEAITRPLVTLSPLAAQPPGNPPKLTLVFRNAPRVAFRVSALRLAEAIAREEALVDPRVQFTQWGLGSIEEARRFCGPTLVQWEPETEHVGEYQTGQMQVEVPVKEVGAYLVEARFQGLRAASVVVISDLTLVQKVHRDGALYLATHAATGEPARDVEVISKQWWWEGEERSAVRRGRTDEQGLLTIPLERGPNRRNFRVSAFARRAERYAVVNPLYTWDVGGNADHARGYTTTDRAVYRPGQTVSYRQVFFQRSGGEWQPVKGRKVRLWVHDPRGNKVEEHEAVTSEFGSLSGSFPLPSEAALGQYAINAQFLDPDLRVRTNAGNAFRVEEYKKPEFEVTVTPTADRVRLGDPTEALVKAEYYFGGPVPGAKVSYRVYRTAHYPYHRFPRPFDFLYGDRNQGYYSQHYRNGEVVQQGEAVTDAKGEARVQFPTAADGSRWGAADLRYTIEADVQDASRRTISGTGEVKATKHDIAVFLNYARGYATEGDRLEVEVATVNASDQPVAAAGAARVYRQPATPDQQEKLVHEEPFRTDAKGRGLFRWTAKPSGHYRIAFVTRDTRGAEVSGSVHVFVNGPELEQGRFLYRNLELRVESPYYEEGQTARALLLTPEADCTVLVTREANNEILEQRLVRVKGRALELRFPLAPRDVPNVYLSAVMVRDHRVFMHTAEVFVPPVRQLARVTVEAEGARHEPGRKARFRLAARDWQGRPLRTELAVSISDASLEYIQKDYAPDIQAYFYGDRRSASIQAGQSGGVYFQNRAEEGVPRGEYRPRPWSMPDGMGLLPDWPGVQHLQFGYPGLRFGRGDGAFRGAMGPTGPAGSAGFALGGGGFGGGFPAAPESAAKAMNADRKEAGAPGGGETRTNFADTAFWSPAVVTGPDGRATVEVTWPDNLTEWRAKAVGHTQAAQVGAAEASVRTRKDLLVRLQAPRFFVERDAVVVSANVHNYQTRDARVKVTLALGDSTAELAPGDEEMRSLCPTAAPTPEVWVDVPRDGERRVDWVVRVRREGSLRVRMAAQSGNVSDATELTFPVLVHGVERAETTGGVLREGNRATVAITLPAARKPGSSELVVQLNPSLGATLLDALPYLVEYPYGCIEQTVSRFLPAVVVEKTLTGLGYDLAALGERARLLEEKQRVDDRARPGGKTVANSPYSYPRGRPGSLRTADLAQNLRRRHNPVFDPQELRQMVLQGIARIQSLQHPDGGWGWWAHDASDGYMSAYVLYGLHLAREADYPVDPGMLHRGQDFLQARFLKEEGPLHVLAYQARVLAMDPGRRPTIRALVVGRLYERRERLSPYSKALLAMALHEVGALPLAEVVLRNLETTARVDEVGGTVSWGDSPDWWRWWNNRVETTAAVLQAHMLIQPQGKLPPMLVKWLVNNQRGSTWNSTRETAMAVYALADYVRETKELAPQYTLTVDLGGRVRRSYQVTRDNAFFFDNQFIVPDELLETGAQTLTLTKEGPGTLYYAAHTRYFSLEEPIRAAGDEIRVRRRYFRLTPGTASGTPVSTRVAEDRPNPFLTGRYELLEAGGEWTAGRDPSDGPRYERRELEPGETVASGDLLEVELLLESRNDYEYLVFEDLKPAGCEPVEVRSGGRAGLGVYSHMELRDQKVAFFIGQLPQGTRALTYRLRAEIPGRFHVLPTNGYAMYAPDIRCLSDEHHLGVKDDAAPAPR